MARSECYTCGAKIIEYPCNYCGSNASPEMKAEATRKIYESLSELQADPANCILFEQIINNDSLLQVLNWSGTRTFMLQVNAIHTECSTPGVHVR